LAPAPASAGGFAREPAPGARVGVRRFKLDGSEQPVLGLAELAHLADGRVDSRLTRRAEHRMPIALDVLLERRQLIGDSRRLRDRRVVLGVDERRR
jgi:hypothetical protein